MPTPEIRSEPGPELTDLPEGANARHPSEYMEPGDMPWTKAEAAYVAEQNAQAGR